MTLMTIFNHHFSW